MTSLLERFAPRYPKINAPFKRFTEGPDKGKFRHGEFSDPVYEYLRCCDWVWTEKVDGMNTRVGYVPFEARTDGEPRWVIGGRTDNAQLSAAVFDVLTDVGKRLWKWRADSDDHHVPLTLYGEAYGAKIQSGGLYRPDTGFVLFDVLVDGRWWLEHSNVAEIADSLGIDAVPLVGQSTLDRAQDLVRYGILDSAWEDAPLEGIVGTPACQLLDRHGKRIQIKVKTKDYA